jgi:hypothetical protein
MWHYLVYYNRSCKAFMRDSLEYASGRRVEAQYAVNGLPFGAGASRLADMRGAAEAGGDAAWAVQGLVNRTPTGVDAVLLEAAEGPHKLMRRHRAFSDRVEIRGKLLTVG